MEIDSVVFGTQLGPADESNQASDFRDRLLIAAQIFQVLQFEGQIKKGRSPFSIETQPSSDPSFQTAAY